MTDKSAIRTAELRDDDLPYSHPIRAAQGWRILAGHDITDKKFRTTRYMLVHNSSPTVKGPRALILTATGKDRTAWTTYAEGKTFDMMQLFDRLEGGPLDG